jgi:tetratricopeptide (TPR) repeat protein
MEPSLLTNRYLIIAQLVLVLILPGFAAAASGDDSIGLTTKGFDLYEQARFKEALIAFEKAIELDPYSSLQWYGKGLASAALNDKEGAISALNRATDLSPKDEQSWLKKGEIYRSMDRNDLAINAYKRALLINPNNNEAKRSLESLGVQVTPTTVDYSKYPSSGPTTAPTPAKSIPFSAPAEIIVILGGLFVAFGCINRINTFLGLNPNKNDYPCVYTFPIIRVLTR